MYREKLDQYFSSFSRERESKVKILVGDEFSSNICLSRDGISRDSEFCWDRKILVIHEKREKERKGKKRNDGGKSVMHSYIYWKLGLPIQGLTETIICSD